MFWDNELQFKSCLKMTLTIKCQYYIHIETSKLTDFSYRTPPLDYNFSAASRKLKHISFSKQVQIWW